MKLLVVGLLCVGLRVANSCSSAPMHPEVLYCKADFVIKIFVGNQKQVYIQEDGTFIDAEIPEEEPFIPPEEEGDGRDDGPPVSEELPPALYPPEPIISDETTEDGTGSESTDTSNEQPEEEEEAGAAPEEGTLINWHGIRTSHASRNKVVSPPIRISLPSNERTSLDNIPAQVVNDGDDELLGIEGPGGAEENSESGTNGEAAARRGPYLAMSFASAARPSYAKLGPNGAMPGASNHFSGVGVRGGPLALRARIAALGKKPRPFQRRKRSSLKTGRRRHSHARVNRDSPPGALHVPDELPSRSSSPTGILMMQYSITVLKVFKGNVENDTQYLYTPPHGGLCIMKLKRKNPYIVMGKFRQNRLHLNQADYNVDVTRLSTTELRHLTSNMKHRYSRGCKDCYIKVCNRRCNDVADTNQCIWKNPYSLMDARASQFACVRTKKGVCEWYNALKPKMTQEDLD